MTRRASTSVPIHDVLAERWSPVGFDRSLIGPSTLAALFEAARWAPSAFNEQPWRFWSHRGATARPSLPC